MRCEYLKSVIHMNSPSLRTTTRVCTKKARYTHFYFDEVEMRNVLVNLCCKHKGSVKRFVARKARGKINDIKSALGKRAEQLRTELNEV